MAGGRVSRVEQTGPADVAIALRGPGRHGAGRRILVVSADTQWARCHLAAEVSPVPAAPFVTMLRGRLERAELRSIVAPAFERLVMLDFDTLEGPGRFVAELVGRHANMLWCQDGVIVGAQRLVPSRGILPGRAYAPPAQTRPTPATAGPDDLSAADAAPAWRAILAAVAGIGPPLAHEVCVRAGIDPHEPIASVAAETLIGVLRDVAARVAERRFAPVIYHDDAGAPLAYAPFPLAVYRGLSETSSSMSEAVDAVTARAAQAAGFDQRRAGLASTIAQAIARNQRALDAVAGDLAVAGGADRHRQYGELLLAYLQRVTPGSDGVEVPGFDGEPVRIALDPAKTTVENAQAYFKRYARAQGALKRLPGRRTALEGESTYLKGLATAIEQAENEDDLVELEHDLVAARLRRPRGPTKRPPAVAARRVFRTTEGGQIMVGRSARENDYLTFDEARPDDLWLHARGIPGAHVILKPARAPASDEDIEAAAGVAAYYSAGRGSGKVPVDVTQRRFVRRVRGGRPGQVHYTDERTLLVAPGLPGTSR